MADRTLQRQIFAGCKQLGIDNETRHDLQLVVTGKASMSDMTDADLESMVQALKEKGFKPGFKAGRRPAAKRADVRFCHVMWRLLFEAKQVKVKGPKGLNAFIRSRFETKWGHVPIDIDAMQDASEIRDVVEALKDWCARSGVELEP
ncbi:phage protein GemA/Gp16 family protein [Celeribacter sp.]|uniref:phage protein GemA/Gp16 family protein n=1 Tax=Celeribacter sp. TaxID=1890673 RepID=UPI003A8EF0E0